MRLLVIFGRPVGFLKPYLPDFLKLKMDSLRYLQPSSYLTRGIAFFIQNFYLCMRL